MKCMCAQTRPRFILSSERVFGGMEFEPMLTPREKSPLPENFPRGGSNPRRCGQRAQTLPTSYSGPLKQIIIIIIAFKGAIRDFLQSPHSAANCLNMYAQVARAQPCANHVQHIERLSHASVMLRATWYEGTAQLLSLTELKSHLFELYFIG